MASNMEIPGLDGERVKAVIAEITERSKAAHEQLTAFSSELVQFNKDNLEALKASGKIFVEGAKPIANDVIANTKRQLDAATETMKSVQAADSMAERIKLQREAAKASFEAYQADAKALSESVVKLVTDAAEPLKVRVQETFKREPVAAAA